jgi:hypothetical protein
MELYPDSSFARWSEKDIRILIPVDSLNNTSQSYWKSYFDEDQFNSLTNSTREPTSEYEKLIWKYIHKSGKISIQDVSLYTMDALLSSIKHQDIFLYTPIIIYIIRRILRMN